MCEISDNSILVNAVPPTSLRWIEGYTKTISFHRFFFLLIAAEGLNVMLNSYVNVGLFIGYVIGEDSNF